MSIGVALAHEDKAHDERELFRLADEALYASKRAGRSRATMYHEITGRTGSKAA
jgi:GGDEF domain-containing protein